MPINRIKQKIIDPITGVRTLKDILIDLEECRQDENSKTYNNERRMVSYVPGLPRDAEGKNAGIANNHVVSLNVDDLFNEIMYALLDYKRTANPYKNGQSYITHLTQVNDTAIRVFDVGPHGLNVHVGDPIVILSNLNGDILEYKIVKSINDHLITLNESLTNTFKKGAFVQNLSNCWSKYPLNKGQCGTIACLQQPANIEFSAKYIDGKIKVAVEELLNIGTIICYDVYVRDEPFRHIEPHWIADISDVPIAQLDCEAYSFNGGKECGYNEFKSGTYYISLITKDDFGRINVNESIPQIRNIIIP